jgi:hypothetical protein
MRGVFAANSSGSVSLNGDLNLYGGTTRVGDSASNYLTVNCTTCRVENATVEFHVASSGSRDQISCSGSFVLGVNLSDTPTLSVIEDGNVAGLFFSLFAYANKTGAKLSDFHSFK